MCLIARLLPRQFGLFRTADVGHTSTDRRSTGPSCVLASSRLGANIAGTSGAAQRAARPAYACTTLQKPRPLQKSREAAQFRTDAVVFTLRFHNRDSAGGGRNQGGRQEDKQTTFYRSHTNSKPTSGSQHLLTDYISSSPKARGKRHVTNVSDGGAGGREEQLHHPLRRR